MNNNIISINEQKHLPSTPMPLADLPVQLFRYRDRLEQIKGQCSDIIHQKYKYGDYDAEISNLTAALEQFEQFAANELPTIVTNVQQAFEKRTTSEDSAVSVAVLIHSFPNVKDNFDSTIFSQQLIRLLEEWEWGEGILALGFRNVILRHKWLPSISEIIDAMFEAQDTLFDTWKKIHGDPKMSNACGIFDVRGTLRYYLNSATQRKNGEETEQKLIDKQ